MMQALFYGLNEKRVLAYTKEDDQKGNVEKGGYMPNPGPLLEVGGTAYEAAFLRSQPKNVLIKLFFDVLPLIPSGDHKIVFMERDPDEIRGSVQRVKEHFKEIGFTKQQKAFAPHIKTFDVFRDYCQEDIDHVLGIMRQRKDCRLFRVDYNELVQRPAMSFESISEWLDLDLDVEKAASLIDEKYYRARKECDQQQQEQPDYPQQ